MFGVSLCPHGLLLSTAFLLFVFFPAVQHSRKVAVDRFFYVLLGPRLILQRPASQYIIRRYVWLERQLWPRGQRRSSSHLVDVMLNCGATYWLHSGRRLDCGRRRAVHGSAQPIDEAIGKRARLSHASGLDVVGTMLQQFCPWTASTHGRQSNLIEKIWGRTSVDGTCMCQCGATSGGPPPFVGLHCWRYAKLTRNSRL